MSELRSGVTTPSLRARSALEIFEDIGSEGGLPSLREIEKAAILRTLRLANGNKSLSASVLGIDRRTLYRKLRLYRLR